MSFNFLRKGRTTIGGRGEEWGRGESKLCRWMIGQKLLIQWIARFVLIFSEVELRVHWWCSCKRWWNHVVLLPAFPSGSLLLLLSVVVVMVVVVVERTIEDVGRGQVGPGQGRPGQSQESSLGDKQNRFREILLAVIRERSSPLLIRFVSRGREGRRGRKVRLHRMQLRNDAIK